MVRHLLCLQVILVIAGVCAVASEPSYYERFNDSRAAGHVGYISEGSLVDTNNAGPILTNAPIRLAKLRAKGEIGGIRLGMTMSEVVAAWGKPQALYTRCWIGPRLIYRHNVSLFFQGDRLVVIVINNWQSRELSFDNGLNGRMGRAAYEKLLGPPSLLEKGDRQGLFLGEIAYMENGVCTDFQFISVKENGTGKATEQLFWIAVRLERELTIKVDGEQKQVHSTPQR